MTIVIENDVRLEHERKENKKREHIEWLCAQGIVYNSADEGEEPKWKLNCYYLAKYVQENYHIKTFLKDKNPEFYVYDGKLYKEFYQQDLRENIAFNDILRKNANLDIDEINQLWIKKSAKDQFSEAILSLSAVEMGLDEMVKETKFIALNNGLYDWENNQLVEFSPDYWITNILPYDYDSEAECPWFDRFIYNICKYKNGNGDMEVDEDFEKFLLMFLGFIFIPMPEKKMALFIKGDTDSGKSVIFNIMKALIGKKNVSHISLDNLNKRFALSNIVDKLLNIHAEVKEDEGSVSSDRRINKIIQSQIFKCLTGDDTVEVERKKKDPFDYDNTAKLVFGMNNIPKFKDSGGGLTNRIYFVELQNSFEIGSEDRIEGIKSLIVDNELPGVFNRVMEALRELRANDFNFPNRNKFRIPDEYAQMGDEFKKICE